MAVAGEHEGVFFHEFSEADFTGSERVENGGGLFDAGEEVVGEEGVCLGSLHAAYEFGVGHELGGFEGARAVDEVKPCDELAVSLRPHFDLESVRCVAMGEDAAEFGGDVLGAYVVVRFRK